MSPSSDHANATALSIDSKQDNLADRAIKTVYAPYYALDDASRAQLQLAIETAPEGRVKDAFAALVNSTPSTRFGDDSCLRYPSTAGKDRPLLQASSESSLPVIALLQIASLAPHPIRA